MKTTLFMLISVDGKISTGPADERDFDKDLPNVTGVNEGLHQYYDLEQETSLFSLNTGRVMAKVGWNEPKTDIKQSPVTFIIIDNQPHLNSKGVNNLLQRTKKLYIVTTNKTHPAMTITNPSLETVIYDDAIDFLNLFTHLKSRGVNHLTVQSGGEMNATLIRTGLIDYVSIVVAPLLVGGRNTPTLVDGDSLQAIDELRMLKPLELISSKVLNDSYLHLHYKVK